MQKIHIFNSSFANSTYYELLHYETNKMVRIFLWGELFFHNNTIENKLQEITSAIIHREYKKIFYYPGNFSFAIQLDSVYYFYCSSLGNYPLYYFNSFNFISVSDNFELLAQKYELKPSAENIASLLWGAECIPYSEINMFEVDSIISFDEHTGFKTLYKHMIPTIDYSRYSFEECCRITKKKVEDAVYNVVTDKKIGLTLSGGMDSSVLAVCLKKFGANFECYHWMSSLYPQINELNYVRDICDLYGIKVHYIDISDSVPNNDGYIDIDENYLIPYNHGSYSWWKKTAVEAKKNGIEYLYTGFRGDTLFSSSFSLLSFKDFVAKDKKWLFQYWLNSFSVINKKHYMNLDESSIQKYSFLFARGADFINQELLKKGITTQNRNNFMFQVESMKANIFDPLKIKIINPYSDRILYEFSNNIPHFYKSIPISGQIFYKPLLRKAFEKELPFSVYSRNSKSNFGILAQKFCSAERHFIEETLLKDSILLKMNVINEEKLKFILKNDKKMFESAYALIRCCFMEIWLKNKVKSSKTV